MSRSGVWYVVDWIFALIFTIEFIVRFAVCDAFEQSNGELDRSFSQTVLSESRLKFMGSIRNIVDLLAVFPFWFENVISWFDITTNGNTSILFLLRIVRIIRVTRLLRLGRVAKAKQAHKHSGAIASISTIFTVIWGIYLYTSSQSC